MALVIVIKMPLLFYTRKRYPLKLIREDWRNKKYVVTQLYQTIRSEIVGFRRGNDSNTFLYNEN